MIVSESEPNDYDDDENTPYGSMNITKHQGMRQFVDYILLETWKP